MALVPPKLIDLMEQLAQGQVGLIVTGYAFVSREGQAAPFQLGVDSDDLFPGITEMANRVHRADGKIVMQVAHGGLFAQPQLTGQEPMGPSAMKTESGSTGREMSRQEIEGIVKAFRESAIRAQRAGFDGVQIHAAHGYLLSQFLSPFFNKRSDEYGGTITNRARLLLELVQNVREAVGDKFPLLVKINTEDFLDGGLGVEDMLAVAKMLEKNGVDAIELSGGTILGILRGTPNTSFSRIGNEANYYESAAKLYKDKVGIPLMLVGGIRSYELSQRLVVEGVCDYVSLCRPLIREPDLVKRWESGDTREAECVSDNACFRPGLEGKGVHCVHVARH